MFWGDVPRSGSEIIAARMRARTVVSGGMMLMGGRVFIALMLERTLMRKKLTPSQADLGYLTCRGLPFPIVQSLTQKFIENTST